MSLTVTKIENAIERAKCCLADMHYKLTLKRAQGSSEAKCIESKVMLLTLYIEALENVLDCNGGEPTNPGGNACNLAALSGGVCWDDATNTIYVLVAHGASNVIPYADYTYEYYVGTSDAGPWTLEPGYTSNYAILTGIDDANTHIKIVVRCNANDTLTREIITEFKVYPATFDAVTFGYFTSTSDTSLSVIPADWYIRQDDSVTISNQNTDFIIDLAVNIDTTTTLASITQSFTIDASTAFSDGDQLTLTFQYIGDSLPPPCSLYRLITVHIIPDPVITASQNPICTGGDCDLSVLNYVYDSYLWSTGETTPTITVSTPGTYSCAVSKGTLTSLIDYELVTASGIVSTPIIKNNGTGLQLANPTYIAAPTLGGSVQNFISADTGYYSGGWPVGTTIDWVSILMGANPATTVASNNGSSYQVVANTPDGCSYTSPIYNVYTVSPTAINITNLLCNGVPTGEIEFVDNLPPGLTVSSCSYALKDSLNNTVETQTVFPPIFSGLDVDTYSVVLTITFTNGLVCAGTLSGIVVTEPAAMSLSTTHTDVTCPVNAGGSLYSGSISFTVTGGTGPYTYLLNDIAIDTVPDATYYYPNVEASIAYTPSVIDANGCTAFGTPFTILIPDDIAVSYTTDCSTGANGKINLVDITGGSGVYPTVELYDSLFALVLDMSAYPLSATGLAVGTYYLAIIDDEGCNYTETIQITAC